MFHSLVFIAPRHERNLIGQTVLQEITLALGSLVEERVVSMAQVSNMVTYGEVRCCASFSRNGIWYQINSRPDFSVNGRDVLPAVSVPNVALDLQSYAAFDAWSRGLLSKNYTLPEGVGVFDTQDEREPFFVSGFYKPNNAAPVRYPAMNLCIDSKTFMNKRTEDFEHRESYVGQCGLYLVANAVAHAKFSKRDRPFMTLGAVTDGKEFTFLAFQLNTLNFDSKKERNFFFRKDMQLINGGKFDEATWAQFKRILSYLLQMEYQDKANHK